VRQATGARKSVAAGLRGGGNPPPSTASLASTPSALSYEDPSAPAAAIGLANSAQILLVSEVSVHHLNARVAARAAAAVRAAAGGGAAAASSDHGDEISYQITAGVYTRPLFSST